ncbi:MAG: T9SS C-terminal target domain-containing protein [Bacteroidetes bacterium]|nr:MAG: T9SS C-terminal target domain-containing protein [Bacteroidota bacterium]
MHKKFYKAVLTFYFATLILFQGMSQELYFPPVTGDNWDTLSPNSLGWCNDKIETLYDFLDSNNSKAFILLKDGKIVLEKYFGDFEQNDNWYWASAGKTITAFMVGMAQQENYLNIHDSTSDYLGEGWTATTPEQEAQITIWHQLTMTTGLDDEVEEGICTLDTCLIYKAEPGTRWAYHNAPYTLLGNVIENATGFTPNFYTHQKLKVPTGMNGAFVDLGYNNVFFSNARSMARFGLLILNNGIWNGNTIMSDTAYFNQMITTSQSINEAYGYLWWLNGKSSYMVPQTQLVFDGFLSPNAPPDMISALGMNGQILNVTPSENMVWIRMGESPDGSLVPYMLNDAIWEYVNDLFCDAVSIPDKKSSESSVKLFPNPVSVSLMIESEMKIEWIKIYNMHGQIIDRIEVMDLNAKLLFEHMIPGLYVVKVYFLNGQNSIRKIVKE